MICLNIYILSAKAHTVCLDIWLHFSDLLTFIYSTYPMAEVITCGT